MTAVWTDKAVTSLRFKDLGRQVIIRKADLLEEFGSDSLICAIEMIEFHERGVVLGVEFWDGSENTLVSAEVEFELGDTVPLGRKP